MGPDGMGLLALVHPDDRAHVSETLENALRKKEPFELTYRIITHGMRKNGSGSKARASMPEARGNRPPSLWRASSTT